MSAQVIHSLSERGIELQVIDGRLQARGEMTDQDRAFIRQHKAELVELLSNPQPTRATELPPDPQTPGHHWLCPKRGWIQSAVEKKPRGFEGQTLTNPTDPAELAELLEWERAQIFPFREQLTDPDPLSALADLPLLPDDRRFITQQLSRIPRNQHAESLREYRARWLATAAAEPDANRRDNQGRRAANLYLLRLPL